MRAFVMAVPVAAACTNKGDIMQLCEETTMPVAWEARSSLGFSADEVLAALGGLAIRVDWTDGTVSEWTTTFGPNGDPAEAVRDRDYVSCEAGTWLLVPVWATFEDAEWLVDGPALLEASGTTRDEIRFHWDGGNLPVKDAPDALQDVLRESRDHCTGVPGEEQTVSFRQSAISGGQLTYSLSYPSCVGGSTGGPFTSL